jgi:energy-coupling factor transporter ATP-binding protein EcfA2
LYSLIKFGANFVSGFKKNKTSPVAFFTEFISADGLVNAQGRVRLAHHLKFTPNQRPIVAQIFGSKPENFLKATQLIAELGSSGVGKSSIVNALFGFAKQQTKTVRESDSRGRHTTTKRELLLLPQGGLVIDTPGMRELQVTADDETIGGTFADIEMLAGKCEFRNCDHIGSQGCAILDAVQHGELDPVRYAQFIKLRKEAEFSASKSDEKLSLQRKAGKKRQAKNIKTVLQNKGRKK